MRKKVYFCFLSCIPLLLAALLLIGTAAPAGAQNLGNSIYGMISADNFAGVEFGSPQDNNNSSSTVRTWTSLPDQARLWVYQASGSTVTLQDDATASNYREGARSLKASYTLRGSGSFFAIFQKCVNSSSACADNAMQDRAVDMRDYQNGTIEFWFKSQIFDAQGNPRTGAVVGSTIVFRPEWYGSTLSRICQSAINLKTLDTNIYDGNWHYLSVNISGLRMTGGTNCNRTNINLASMRIPAAFDATNNGTEQINFWVDNVIWRKKDEGTKASSSFFSLRNLSDGSAASQITWSHLSATNRKWILSDQYIELNTDSLPTGGPSADFSTFMRNNNVGIQVYTDNSSFSGAAPDPGGLISADSKTYVPMAWHIDDAKLAWKDGITITQGGTCNGTRYTERLWTPSLGGACNPSFLWMKDKKNNLTVGQDYSVAWDLKRGIQYAEASRGGAQSPNYIYLAADFSGAAAESSYSTNNLVLELYYE